MDEYTLYNNESLIAGEQCSVQRLQDFQGGFCQACSKQGLDHVKGQEVSLKPAR